MSCRAPLESRLPLDGCFLCCLSLCRKTLATKPQARTKQEQSTTKRINCKWDMSKRNQVVPEVPRSSARSGKANNMACHRLSTKTHRRFEDHPPQCAACYCWCSPHEWSGSRCHHHPISCGRSGAPDGRPKWWAHFGRSPRPHHLPQLKAENFLKGQVLRLGLQKIFFGREGYQKEGYRLLRKEKHVKLSSKSFRC